MSNPQGFDDWFETDDWRDGQTDYEIAPGISITVDVDELQAMIKKALAESKVIRWTPNGTAPLDDTE